LSDAERRCRRSRGDSSCQQEILQEVAQEIAVGVAASRSPPARWPRRSASPRPTSRTRWSRRRQVIHAAGTLGASTGSHRYCSTRRASAHSPCGRCCTPRCWVPAHPQCRLARRSSVGLAGGSAGGAGQLMRIAINLATRPFVELRPLCSRGFAWHNGRAGAHRNRARRRPAPAERHARAPPRRGWTIPQGADARRPDRAADQRGAHARSRGTSAVLARSTSSSTTFLPARASVGPR
jgi:hypothetical protein